MLSRIRHCLPNLETPLNPSPIQSFLRNFVPFFPTQRYRPGEQFTYISHPRAQNTVSLITFSKFFQISMASHSSITSTFGSVASRITLPCLLLVAEPGPLRGFCHLSYVFLNFFDRIPSLNSIKALEIVKSRIPIFSRGISVARPNRALDTKYSATSAEFLVSVFPRDISEN